MNEFQNLVHKAALEIPSYSIKAIKDGSHILVKALGDVKIVDDFDHKTGERKSDKQGNPASLNLLHIVDSDGVEGEMVLPFLLARAMETASKDGPVTGRFFKFSKIRSESNKTTSWRVDELIQKDKNEKGKV